MSHFKDADGQVFWLDDDLRVRAGLVLVDDAEAELLRVAWVERVAASLAVAVSPTDYSGRIQVVEASITARQLRGAALGDQFAIAKIQAIETEIAAIRVEAKAAGVIL